MKYQKIIDQMALEEKIALCSGADFFNTKAFELYGIPSIWMADGPHGLRKQLAAADHLGLNQSIPSTCFPTASLSACSWDRNLLREMGAAIGEEAQQEGVSIVLGPGINIKRNPLCGRNFEYFSEDPYLAGEMAASWIEGVQSQGVGASLKHFAVNNQENERMASDSIVDERALRELYLPAFERAVRQKPATVMCAYNKLNGVYCSDNHILLRKILRDEWDFGGVVVTDWGAMNNRLKAFEAGTDLEMPGSKGFFDQEVIEAVRSGALSEERINESVDRLLELIFSTTSKRRPKYRYDTKQHHLLAKKIAAQSAVLLKNEGNILPIHKDQKIAIIGALAQNSRYQGSGSSHINPISLTSPVEGFTAVGFEFAYYPGYALKGTTNPALLDEAAAGAKRCDIAVIFAGLPDAYESEGFDRDNLAMPDSQNMLIERVAAANPNTVVVLVGGAPVEMPWLPQVRAVLNLYLAGQAGGLAVAELIAGIAIPSGKLAETYPLRYEDVPSAGFYETGGKQAQYREGIYVGYRYYDSARKAVLFPFGHGLSYTTFEYSDLAISSRDLNTPYALQGSLTLKNTGERDGAEVVQVYVSSLQPSVYRPEKELKAFTKVHLQAGETQRVNFGLDARSFAVYNPELCDWVVPGGIYQIRVGASSRDLRLQAEVRVEGLLSEPVARQVPQWYHQPQGNVSQPDFEALLGRNIEPVKLPRKGSYTLECSFQDMHSSFIIRQLIKIIERTLAQGFGGKVDYTNPTFKMMVASAINNPLRSISLVSPESMPRHITNGFVYLANGRFVQGILSMLRKPKGR